MPQSRNSFLYDLARSQTDFEQQISIELATRGGLLAALAGLVAVGLADVWQIHGNVYLLLLSGALLFLGVVALAVGSIGMVYERPAAAQAWDAWAKREEGEGKLPGFVDGEMAKLIFERYAEAARVGLEANDRKSTFLTFASGLITLSLLCLILGLLLG